MSTTCVLTDNDVITTNCTMNHSDEVRLLFLDPRSAYFHGDHETELLSVLLKCDFEEVLKCPRIRSMLDNCTKPNARRSNEENIAGNWCEDIRDCISVEQKDEFLYCGISALQAFVQCNWTGPVISESVFELLPYLSNYFASTTESYSWAVNHLSQGEEKAYHLVKHPELLLLARTLLVDCPESCPAWCPLVASWWKCRCLIIHQNILTDRSPSIYSMLKSELDNLHKLDAALENCIGARVQLNLEAAQFLLYYHEVLEARKYLETAQGLLKLEVELSGTLGKRTKFQEKAVSQLLIKVKTDHQHQELLSSGLDSPFLPKDIKLNDDTLLNKTEYENSESLHPKKLHPEEQAVVISLCKEMKRSHADHPLVHEELMAYIQNLLNQPSVWSVHFQCLLLRSKMERNSSRRVERTLKQMEELIGSISKKDPPAAPRLCLFYSVMYPPIWHLEKELAGLLVSLGDIKSALEIFTRLQMWEEIVLCYLQLQRNDKAEAIIRQRLEIEENPLMYCLLGDVTNDISHYHKAWDMSNHKSARAQRSLGMFYYKKKEYEMSIRHFQLALEINSLQMATWFSLAYAAMQVEDYELCAKAYRHVVNLDPDNFEAWNNLSNAYIKTRQKQRAWYTLQEALKCNYEEWRIWENYLVVSMDIGAFDEAIRAWHRVIDIKGKFLDDEMLGILVKGISSDVKDLYDESSSKYLRKALELMGRIVSTCTATSQTWSLYAQLHLSDPSARDDPVVMQKVAQYLQKAHRCSIMNTGWEKDASKCKEVLLHTADLAENYIICSELFRDAEEVKKILSSAKLAVRNVLNLVSKHKEDFTGNDANCINDAVNNLESKLQQILSKLGQS